MENERRAVNALQKEIGQIKKAKGDASELLKKKVEHDKKIAELTAKAAELARIRDAKASRIGNIVDDKNHVSLTEVSPIASSICDISY
jgi:seryl-tRNA synthetase